MEDNEDLCLKLISMIIKIPVDDLALVESIQTQKAIKNTLDGKGIRMDVLVKTTGAVYDIEMQATQRDDNGKRIRYYQSTMDRDLLDKGQEYEDLPRSFIIFICPFDPFEKDDPVYRFTMASREHPEIDLQTEMEAIFVCATSGSIEKCVDSDLKAFLQFMLTNQASDAYTEQVAEALYKASQDKEWRTQMLTFDMRLRDERKAGRREGKMEGRAEGKVLGAQEKSKETALRMLADDMPLDLIQKYTALSLEQIKTLKNTMQNSNQL